MFFVYLLVGEFDGDVVVIVDSGLVWGKSVVCN